MGLEQRPFGLHTDMQMNRPSPHRTLQWTLVLSVLVHLGLLTLRFAAPEVFNRVFEDTPLEVVLVNARSNERPKDAQALAQVSLAGGGNVTEVLMSSSPLPGCSITARWPQRLSARAQKPSGTPTPRRKR